MISGPPGPKQRNFQPASLQNLAFEALRYYVYDFGVRLIQSVEMNSKKLHSAIQGCSCLQDMLHSMVPVSFANEVTEKLLISIDDIYKDIRACTKESWCNKILQELVRAIIHPTVTRLDVHCTLRLIPGILFSRLCTMKRLKVLKLWHLMDQTCEVFIIEGLHAMVDLEIFALNHHCSDNIIMAIGSTCRKLKVLDVAFSSCITDISIGAILKLECLEELNILDTSISEKGYTKLLNGLSHHIVNESLLKFGCSRIKTSHFNVLLSGFQNLVEINIRRCCCDSSIMAGLQNLQTVRFTDCKFSDIQALIVIKGSQLIELQLEKVRDINVKVIGENCLSLQRLTISGYVRHVPRFENNNVPLPGFQSLQHLSLYLYRDEHFIAYILSECTNLKTVDIFITDGSEQESYLIMEFVLSRNTLKCLEEISIKTHMSGLLSSHTAKLLIECCPGIISLKGVNTWSSIGILEDFIDEMAENYPHIQLGE